MNTAFVTLCDKSYYPKALNTLRDLRSRGKWSGTIVLIAVDFYPDMNELNDMNILLYPTKHIDTSYLVQQLKEHPIDIYKNIPEGVPEYFTVPSGIDDNRHLGKLYQWDKLQVFSPFFKQWKRIVFLDAGMRIFNSVQACLEIPWEGKLVAPDDASEDFSKRFGRQIRIYANQEVKERLFADFGFSDAIMYERYFLNCIFIYDTTLLDRISFTDLVEGMNKYPICGTNEMTLMNLYFTFKLKVWAPMPDYVNSCKKRIFGWSELNYPNKPNCSEFCFIKYPVTHYIEPKYPQYQNTLVSMFFDLHKLTDATKETRPLDFYISKGKYTLSLPFPLVLFCDSNTRPIIQSIRESCVDTEKVPTVYIEKDFTEYDFYKFHMNSIQAHRKDVNIYKDHRNTPSIFLLYMFKIVALEQARQLNYFNTSHITWFDLGCYHVAPDDFEVSAIKMLSNPNPKISVCYIHYRDKTVLESMKEYVPGGPCAIAGGIITCEINYIERFYNCIMSIFHEMLSHGVGHSDETCLTYCYTRYPELFTLYYGDYYSIIKNYHHIKRDYSTIKYFFLDKVLYYGRMDLAKGVAQKIQESVDLGYISIPNEDKNLISHILKN